MVNKSNNIFYSKGKVSYDDRCKVLKQRGLVLWFTGLSGSGKSTIAIELEKRLIKLNKVAYRLDGDNIRTGLNSDLSFSKQDRDENIRRIAEVCALFKDAGIITLVSFISPFRKMREYAKKRVGKDSFYEIYIKADLDICKKRDTKGLYKKAENNEIQDFTGVSSKYEEPENPALIIDTTLLSVKESVDKIVDSINFNF
jgi:adenylyl-sulfate kinase